MGRTVKIFDTTLRDGEQSPGCSMNLNEKIEVAKQLEALKVDIIECGQTLHGGWSSMPPRYPAHGSVPASRW